MKRRTRRLLPTMPSGSSRFLAEVADGMPSISLSDAQEIAARRPDARSRAAVGPEAACQGDGIALRTDGVRHHACDALDAPGAARDSRFVVSVGARHE